MLSRLLDSISNPPTGSRPDRHARPKLLALVVCIGLLANPQTYCFSAESNQKQNTTNSISLRPPIPIEPGTTRLVFRADHGVSYLERGSTFPAILLTELDSSTTRTGQPIEAMLLDDLIAGQVMVAPAGSKMKGWVSGVRKPRRSLEAKLPDDRFLKGNAGIRLYLSSITTPSGKVHKIRATLAPQMPISGNPGPEQLQVDKHNYASIASNTAKYTGTQVAIGAAGIATGPLGLIVGPALSAGASIADPGYAYGKKLYDPTPELRAKAIGRGLLKGLPGSFLFFGFEEKGDHITIARGSEIPVALTCDFFIADKQIANKKSE